MSQDSEVSHRDVSLKTLSFPTPSLLLRACQSGATSLFAFSYKLGKKLYAERHNEKETKKEREIREAKEREEEGGGEEVKEEEKAGTKRKVRVGVLGESWCNLLEMRGHDRR